MRAFEHPHVRSVHGRHSVPGLADTALVSHVQAALLSESYIGTPSGAVFDAGVSKPHEVCSASPRGVPDVLPLIVNYSGTLFTCDQTSDTPTAPTRIFARFRPG